MASSGISEIQAHPDPISCPLGGTAVMGDPQCGLSGGRGIEPPPWPSALTLWNLQPPLKLSTSALDGEAVRIVCLMPCFSPPGCLACPSMSRLCRQQSQASQPGAPTAAPSNVTDHWCLPGGTKSTGPGMPVALPWLSGPGQMSLHDGSTPGQ